MGENNKLIGLLNYEDYPEEQRELVKDFNKKLLEFDQKKHYRVEQKDHDKLDMHDSKTKTKNRMNSNSGRNQEYRCGTKKVKCMKNEHINEIKKTILRELWSSYGYIIENANNGLPDMFYVNQSYQQVRMPKKNIESMNNHYLIDVRDFTREIKKKIGEITKENMIKQYELDLQTMELIYTFLDSGSWSMEFDENYHMVKCKWNDIFRNMVGYKSKEEFPDTLESWSNLLYEKDKERVMKIYWDTVNDSTGKKYYDVEYRLYTKDRGLRWFHTAGRLLRRKDGSPIIFVGMLTDIDDRKRAAQKVEEQMFIVEALSRDYLNVLKVNVEESSFELIKEGGYFPSMLKRNTKKEYDYYHVLEQYAKERVFYEDLNQFLLSSKLEHVLEELEKSPEYLLNYRVLEDGKIHYFQLKYIRVKGIAGENQILVGFRNVDIAVNALKEREMLKMMSETDTMTNLLNRGSGQNRVCNEIANGKHGMFCIIDIDKFKSINDTYGHDVGDKVIVCVANCLKKAFRTDDIVFRLGGDEFAAFAHNVTNKKIATRMIQRFFKNLDAIRLKELGERKICASVGAIIIRDEICQSFEYIYKVADIGVYDSKKLVGNQITFANYN